jgi:hypothetical protein
MGFDLKEKGLIFAGVLLTGAALVLCPLVGASALLYRSTPADSDVGTSSGGAGAVFAATKEATVVPSPQPTSTSSVPSPSLTLTSAITPLPEPSATPIPITSTSVPSDTPVPQADLACVDLKRTQGMTVDSDHVFEYAIQNIGTAGHASTYRIEYTFYRDDGTGYTKDIVVAPESPALDPGERYSDSFTIHMRSTYQGEWELRLNLRARGSEILDDDNGANNDCELILSVFPKIQVTPKSF